MIYLDNAATTFPKPESVYSMMDQVNREHCVNAGRGSYKLAQWASGLINHTKDALRKLVHTDLETPVVFSPSITIALNQIINGYEWKDGDTIYLSPYEHNAVARTVNHLLSNYKLNVVLLPINVETLEIDIDALRYEFSKRKPTAVICTHVSNVTGYVLPVSEIFDEAKKYNALTVLDSAQSLGLIPIDSSLMKIDIIAFAGHKTLYGPFGIGGFINVGHVKLKEFITGGTGSDSLNLDMPLGEESKYEAASTNIVAVAGLYAAIKEVKENLDTQNEQKLLQMLIDGLMKIHGIKVFSYPQGVNQVGIVSFTVSGYHSEDIGIFLDEDFGIQVRTGYHCAPYIHKYLRDESTLGTVRVGIGRFNTEHDIEALLKALEEIIEE